jgi:uncharacterized membrane protein
VDDPNINRLIKSQDRYADESGRAGWWLVGGVVLILGGVILILQAHASVADFGGAMLLLIGLAVTAASLWLTWQRPSS